MTPSSVPKPCGQKSLSAGELHWACLFCPYPPLSRGERKSLRKNGSVLCPPLMGASAGGCYWGMSPVFVPRGRSCGQGRQWESSVSALPSVLGDL